jgi:hypothetical protein
MKSLYEQGVRDARIGDEPHTPTKDAYDYIGIDHSDEEIKSRTEEYLSGYETGTQQRVADSNSK